jgi:(5-formylfuran-3-yl)methyl phosphate synthase
MQLLVSVRSAAEVEPAVIGGADIIDAKEPSNGSLGAVSTATLGDIMQTVPETVPLSIALGDVSHRTEVAQSIAAVPARSGCASCYVKLGFAGVSSPRQVRALLDEGRKAARCHPSRLLVVAVGYADAELSGSIDPEQLCRAAVVSGVTGVLVDTQVKTHGNLLTRMSLSTLTGLVADIQRNGMLAALAGSLESRHLRLVAAARPDIVGVRRAACIGARDGVVSRLRVQQLRRRLGAASDFIRNWDPDQVLGETPDGPANLSSLY